MGSTPYNPFYEVEEFFKKTEKEIKNAGRDINREWLKIDPITQLRRTMQAQMEEQQKAQERLFAQQQQERVKQEERTQRSLALQQLRARQRALSSSGAPSRGTILTSPIGILGGPSGRKTLLGS